MMNTIERCCPAMQTAVDGGYLEVNITSGWKSKGDKRVAVLEPLPPAIPGPRVSPRSRKTKPPIILSACPWCGHKYHEVGLETWQK